MHPKTVNFQQVRGSWIATAATARDAQLLGHRRLPVIRDFGNGDFTWSRDGVAVIVSPDTSKDEKTPIWWMLDRNAEWRSLLEAKTPTLIRKGSGWAHRNCIEPASSWRLPRRPRTEACTRVDLSRRHT